MRISGYLLSFTFVLTGCASVKVPTDPGVICTMIAVSSLNVTVRDASTGTPVCDATVTALLGGENYSLRQTGDCRYAGPEERAGSFEVSVVRTGYLPTAVTNVRVGRDECHVIPVAVTVDLRPAP
jgi:hypothetical protein